MTGGGFSLQRGHKCLRAGETGIPSMKLRETSDLLTADCYPIGIAPKVDSGCNRISLHARRRVGASLLAADEFRGCSARTWTSAAVVADCDAFANKLLARVIKPERVKRKHTEDPTT